MPNPKVKPPDAAAPAEAPATVVEVSVTEARDEGVLAATGDFLAGTGCFKCDKLKARITQQTCVERQGRPEKKQRYYGRIVTMNANPLDRFCSSGKCGLGKFVKRQLRELKRAKKEREKEARKAAQLAKKKEKKAKKGK